jgi:hypothetical protein
MIKRANLSSSLVQWMASTLQMGPGIGDVHYLVTSADAFHLWLIDQKVDAAHIHHTLATAEDALVTGRNDVMVVMPGSFATTTAFTWDKNYTHIVGLNPGRMNSRSKIYTSTVTASTTPMFTITGANCQIYNTMFSCEGSHATYNAVPLYVNGHRNYFENIHTRNIGALAVVDNSHRSLKLGTIYDTYFKNCQFGETSYDAATASSTVIEFAGTDGGKYMFDDCMILGAGSANATFFTMGANVGGFTLFKRCLFHNSTISGLDAMTQAFSISGTGNDGVFLMDCLVNGAAAYETSDSGVLFGRHAYAAATTDLAVALTY